MKRWLWVLLAGCAPGTNPAPVARKPAEPSPVVEKAAMKSADDPAKLTEEEWQKKLTPEEFYVTRRKGTEAAFSGKFDEHFGKGIYTCVCCGAALFSSDTKYKSKCGWPSYWAPIKEDAVTYDVGSPANGAEIMCKKCGSHLGHLFHDGPPPTGFRY